MPLRQAVRSEVKTDLIAITGIRNLKAVTGIRILEPRMIQKANMSRTVVQSQ